MRRVAVTGVGVVSPIGNDVESFFDGLQHARSGIDAITRFDASSFRTWIAGEVTGFNHSDVVIAGEHRAALHRDAKSVFGLVAAREAVANAFGETPPSELYEPLRIGVVVAAGLEIFHLDDLLPHLHHGSVDAASLIEAMRSHELYSRLQIPSHLGARAIQCELGAKGCFSVNLSACAAGTQALGEGFRAVRDGVADCVVSGGYDSMVNPLGVGGFTLLGALSTSNELKGAASRPFDRRRDGFVLGEGAGMVVLEELGAARKRGAHILAEVLGYGSRLDAHHVSDPRPDFTGAVAAMRAALADAGIEAAAVDYVNAHGTSTPKNDSAETRAIRIALGERADQIPVSSTKSQVGHLIGAAGAVEFVACIFALTRQIAPATLNLSEPDPECDLDYVAGRPRPAVIHTVLSNSLGFGGQNATIVLGTPRT